MPDHPSKSRLPSRTQPEPHNQCSLGGGLISFASPSSRFNVCRDKHHAESGTNPDRAEFSHQLRFSWLRARRFMAFKPDNASARLLVTYVEKLSQNGFRRYN